MAKFLQNEYHLNKFPDVLDRENENLYFTFLMYLDRFLKQRHLQ